MTSCCGPDSPHTSSEVQLLAQAASYQPPPDPAVSTTPASDTDHHPGATSSPSGLVQVPPGPFLMGDAHGLGYPEDHEGPPRLVATGEYAISPQAVNNAEFASFIHATGHRTTAEQRGWSYVFGPFINQEAWSDVDTTIPSSPSWWRALRGARWDKPTGRDSDIESLLNHPVVHVSWHDAQAYAHWRGCGLPTEAQWEKAAQAGSSTVYPWGNELLVDGKHACNVWQGTFPTHNTGDDGFIATAPVTAYEPNSYGLYNCLGNVWEWCDDAFRPLMSPANRADISLDGNMRVQKGGSYLCHRSYCFRYRSSARTGAQATTTTGHTGFRIALSSE